MLVVNSFGASKRRDVITQFIGVLYSPLLIPLKPSNQGSVGINIWLIQNAMQYEIIAVLLIPSSRIVHMKRIMNGEIKRMVIPFGFDPVRMTAYCLL